MDFHQIWYVHLCYGDLLWDCSMANFVKYDSVICPLHDNGWVLSFHVLFPLCIALLRKVLFPEKFIILFFSSNTAFEKGRKKVFSIKYAPFEVYPFISWLTSFIMVNRYKFRGGNCQNRFASTLTSDIFLKERICFSRKEFASAGSK